VGVRAADGRAQFLAGAQLTTAGQPAQSLGYVSSSVYSPALDEWIGLAFLARDHAAEGTVVIARDPLRGAGDATLTVTPLVHYDPAAERMKS
jgi:glycine cleavage system aminomethyltransferase T